MRGADRGSGEGLLATYSVRKPDVAFNAEHMMRSIHIVVAALKSYRVTPRSGREIVSLSDVEHACGAERAEVDFPTSETDRPDNRDGLQCSIRSNRKSPAHLTL